MAQKNQTGLAGEFWFFSQLQRLGYQSYITLGNTKSVDIAVKLQSGKILTFDVKTKANFAGSFQYLMNIPTHEDHFIVFVNLESTINSNGKTNLIKDANCYIVNSSRLSDIAFHWTSSTKTKGYGFEAKLLWYLKFQNTTSITQKNISDFKFRHQIATDIDFNHYNKIILSLNDFEDLYYNIK